MVNLRSVFCAAFVALALPVAGHTATLASFNHNYGNGEDGGGSYVPQGSEELRIDRVKITEPSTFRDSFDFSSTPAENIASFELILDIRNFTGLDEVWELEIFGGPSEFRIDLTDLTRQRDGTNSTFVLDIDVSSSLFSSVVANEVFSFGFVENTAGEGKFNLYEATLNIGSNDLQLNRIVQEQVPPAVPLPASGLLLLGSLFGMRALRRRS